MGVMRTIAINGRIVGNGEPVYVIAEISANHNKSFDEAVRIVCAAKNAGADAIKLQTYTPDTLTINCSNEYFRVAEGTIWEGRNLYDLYKDAYTPWEWQPKLKTIANDLGMDLFSSPFDESSVDFLQKINVPAFKVASFELVDTPLIKYLAKKGKPIIISTGMGTLSEIDEAVSAVREVGCKEFALVKCTSAYPALPEEMNLRTIPHLAEAFDCPVGLSDHTLGIAVPIAAVAMGACIIEKHLTLSRSVSGPDSAFSLEPVEFKAMVEAIRIAEKALGSVQYRLTEGEVASRIFRRSLFVVRDIKKGEIFTESNIRSIRPGYGLAPKFIGEVLGRSAATDLAAGTPLQWSHIA